MEGNTVSKRVPLRTKRQKTGPSLRRLQRKLWDLRADQYNLWIKLRAAEIRLGSCIEWVRKHCANNENTQQLIRAVAVMWAHDPPTYIEPVLVGGSSSVGTAALGSRRDGHGMLSGETSEWVEMVTDDDALTMRVVLDGNVAPELHVDFERGQT